jgi:Tol biopolymer transport system component
MKIFVSYKRDHAESEALLSLLETELRSAHTTISSDRLLTAGEWRPKLLEWIDGCDLFVVLLSERSLESEEIRDEVHRAYDRWLRTGRKRPTIIPVSVNYSGPLGGFKRDLSVFQGLRWTGEGDDDTLPNKIREEVRRKRRPKVYGAAMAALLLAVVLLFSFAPASLRDILKPRTPSEGRPDNARILSVRQITNVNDVIAVAVSPDAKTVFVNRLGNAQSAGVYITDVNGAPPRKLFSTWGGTMACGKANCYLSGVIDEKRGVYRFSASEAPMMLFSGEFGGIDIHPAGDRLLLTRSDETQTNEIVVRRIDDGSQTVERSSRGWMNYVSQASWHPDGKSILYAESGRGAVLHNLATGKRVSLPKASASISLVAWETRGRYVLALSGTAIGSEFWILQPEGQPIGPVLRDEVWFNDLRATPLPDTFSAVRVERHAIPQLASLGPQAEIRPIARMNFTSPLSWSDPEHLVYVAQDGTGTWIEEYDVNAQQERRLSPTGWFRDLAMTPDGARLVFSMATDANPGDGLWTSPADRWNPVKLAQLPTVNHAISPDSKWVAFAAFGPEGGLYVTSIEPGGEVRRLMRGRIGQVLFADPRTIVFLRHSPGRRPLCKISRDAGPESCFALEADVFAVSPDRKTVVAVKSAENPTRLHFIDLASGFVRGVATVPGSIDTAGGLAWTTGDSIVYVTSTGFQRAVEAYRIADGANKVVSKSADGFVRHVAASPDGRDAVFLRERTSSDAVLLTVTPP